MKYYKIRWKVYIENGLGYIVREELRDKIYQAESSDQARDIFTQDMPGWEFYDICPVMEVENETQRH